MVIFTQNKFGIVAKMIIGIFAFIGFSFVTVYFAMKVGLTNTNGIIDEQSKNFVEVASTTQKYTPFPLAHTPEWIAFKQAVAKDAPVIKKVSKETGVPERLLVALLVPEQMRLFYSNRAIFKEFFEPMKVLGSQSQFSWGIYGIKDETARGIEAHLKDKSSKFYLGTKFENIFDFKTSEPDQERFSRIIDENDHYYTYLYTAIYILQIESQWKKAGFTITNRPEIIATLWNIGFERSTPNANPSSGGSVLDINDKKYSFGAMAKEFYGSDELVEVFP